MSDPQRVLLLESLVKKAETNELIVGLIEALGNNDLNVLKEACSILSYIGDKAGTNEVIAALHNVLRTEDKDMGFWICIALRKIGEKAANDKGDRLSRQYSYRQELWSPNKCM